MQEYQIAQINVGKILGSDINDPVMKEFVDNLPVINGIAESSEGYVWRLKDESDSATAFNPYNDNRIIINISVWKDISCLEKFVFQSMHLDFLKRRREWFEKYAKFYFAMWWIKVGEYPTIEEAVAKLDYMDANGPSQVAFNFKEKFTPQ
jgi:hypothetical protein